jgi:ABC-type lipoprotein release transport system permease subunit
LLRSLTHYWRLNLAVLLGAAVAGAVLGGALLVGDSIRGSLRDLALDRLGRIDSALVSERFFREDLAAGLDAAPVILLRGAASLPGSGARASGIAVVGADERFAAMFPGSGGVAPPRGPGQLFPPVILNESLRAELGAAIGDAVLLHVPRGDDVPRDTVLGRRDREHVLGTLRGTVAGVAPDRGAGRFGLEARQGAARNAYVALADLQRSLGERRRVNALLLAGPPEVRPRFDDLGLFAVRTNDYVAIESREFVLRPQAVAAIEAAAAAIGAPSRTLQTYLANELRIGDRSIPYSMVTAVDPEGSGALPWLRLAGGSPAPALAADEILLGEWAALDLGARPGDPVILACYVLGERDDLRVAEATFRLRGVVAHDGLGADPDLTPDYPGIGDSADMSSWDPPFPIDLARIRPRDEAYWDEFRGTPKAFVSAAAGRRLWANRFGTVTAVQVGAAPGLDLTESARRLEAEIERAADPAAFGFRRLPLREESLAASEGSTDFAGLFLAFSMFLILSAALLVGLLFRLGVEQRAREVGLLLAVGHPVRRVRRRFLGEAVLLAVAGALGGAGAGTGYAWLMLAGLRSWWRPAVGTSLLALHVEATTLALGFGISVLVVVASVAATIRELGRMPAVALLAGSTRADGRRRTPGWRSRAAGWAALAAALALVGIGAAAGEGSSAGAFFAAGALLLASGLAFFSLWCRRKRRARPVGTGRAALAAMAARGATGSPGRSILSAAMVACACFVIVAAAANRHGPGDPVADRRSGAGGFALMAASDVPLYHDLGTPEGRAELGLPASVEAAMEGVEVVGLRLLPGDDASCLNLFRPRRPRVLGVPRALVERGGFTFSAAAEDVANPWELLERPIEPGVIPAIGDAASVRWILHLGLGQDVVLEDEAGREMRLRFVGLLTGSIFQSDVLIAEDAFLRHFPSRGGRAAFLLDTGGADPGRVAAALEAGLAPFGFDVTATADRLAGFAAVQNTYLSTFLLLGGLGLLLGTVGLGVVLARNALERRGDLATLRAFGFRRSRLGGMILAESAFLLVTGVGLGAGSALLAVAPHLLSTRAGVPWPALAGTLAAVLAFGLLSSVAAVRGVLRAPLLPALKAEP